MINPFELSKQRNIVFAAEPPGQIERAYQLLSGLPGCKAERGDSPNLLRVSYNLHNHTLEGLESGLAEKGFRLDHSLLRKIRRKVIYYCEDTICHNLDIPAYPTKIIQHEVFVKAYEHEPHGDHDDISPELRNYN